MNIGTKFHYLLAVAALAIIPLVRGEPEKKDFTPEFVAQCKAKAEGGDAEAQAIYGRALSNGWGVEKDEAKAVEWLRKAAMAGNAIGQCSLGACYDNGTGVAKDEAKAVEWYMKAAEQGLPRAQCNLGYAYEYGEGVKKDEAKAVEWYMKAAEQGDARGQWKLGNCYKWGTGVAKDEAKAVEWYMKAAAQGFAFAQLYLGECYHFGRGVAKDMSKAVGWYRKAAEQGEDEAQYRLGVCYKEGTGIDEDEDKAIEWYRKAAEQGHVKALVKLCDARMQGRLKAKRNAAGRGAKPGEVAAAYIEAMRAKRYLDAWEMVSSDMMTQTMWKTLIGTEKDKRELGEFYKAIKSYSIGKVKEGDNNAMVSVNVTFENGKTDEHFVIIRQEDGELKIADPNLPNGEALMWMYGR